MPGPEELCSPSKDQSKKLMKGEAVSDCGVDR